MEIALLVITILFLTITSGYTSAAETSLFSLSATRVRGYENSSDERKKLIAALLKHPRDLLVTIMLMNIAVNILVQSFSSDAFGEDSGWLLRVGVPFFLTLVFGEIIPKSMGLKNNALISYYIAPSIATSQKLLGPLRRAITSTTAFLSHFLFFFLRKEDPISNDELKHMLDTSLQDGVLHKDEAELIHGYFDLQEAQIRELMRPREEIIFYDVNEPLERLVEKFVDEECSRVPICDGDVDNTIGVMSAKRFLLNRQHINSPATLQPYMVKPFFVPETTPARRVLRQLNARNQDLAIVVDEYGTVTGLVALEDLYEMVVGDIQDRRDGEELFTRAGNDVVIASGKMELVEFEDLFGISLDSPNSMVTIGGWLTEQLGDIPKSGTNYVTKEFLFHVLAADATRVRRIYIRRVHSQKETP